MIYKIYQKYLINDFIKIFLKTSFVFFVLILLLNILEEISFFKDEGEASMLLPIKLTLLNSPSVLFDIFPFIFFITAQFFFIKILDNQEINILKFYGISNFQIIKLLALITFILSIIINIFFYNISAKLKFNYLEIKNGYSNDDKYLATITDNGMWIKDEINGNFNIIHASKVEDATLINIQIMQFDKSFNLEQSIFSDKADIKKKLWVLEKVKISKNNQLIEKNKFLFESNFNSEKINKLFSDLHSLTYFQLKELKENYFNLGYTTADVDVHFNNLYKYSFYTTLMTIFASIIMFYIRRDQSKVFYLILGIVISVVIYYINYFSNILGQNLNLSPLFSSCAPLILLMLVSSIQLININEK